MDKKISRKHQDAIASLEGYLNSVYKEGHKILDYDYEVQLTPDRHYINPEGSLFPEHYVVPELVGKHAIHHPFVDLLIELVNRDGRSGKDLYGEYEIYFSRKTFSKMLQGKSISKENILRLAILLRLNVEETLDLLGYGGFGVSKGIRRDLIIMFAIEHKIYDPDEVDETLLDYGEEPLFNKEK